MASDEIVMASVESSLRARLDRAVRSLRLDPDDLRLLRHRKGAAAVVHVDGVVVKVFEESHREYFERERLALRALTSTGLVPEEVEVGELWIATTWCDLVPPEHHGADTALVHRWLGETLAQLHRVDPSDLAPLPLQPRLAHWLATASEAVVPPSLRRGIETRVLPFVPLLQAGHFVHGDWGSSNVLVQREGPTGIDKVVDLEDARRGDAAEDFKWQLIDGPPWQVYGHMAEAYRGAGGDLGPNGTERLVVAATDWALDVLTWYPMHSSPFAAGRSPHWEHSRAGLGQTHRDAPRDRHLVLA